MWLSFWLHGHIHTFPVCNSGQIIRPKHVEDMGHSSHPAQTVTLHRRWNIWSDNFKGEAVTSLRLRGNYFTDKTFTFFPMESGSASAALSVAGTFLPFVHSVLRLYVSYCLITVKEEGVDAALHTWLSSSNSLLKSNTVAFLHSALHRNEWVGFKPLVTTHIELVELEIINILIEINVLSCACSLQEKSPAQRQWCISHFLIGNKQV